jgi:hypothetical protein
MGGFEGFRPTEVHTGQTIEGEGPERTGELKETRDYLIKSGSKTGELVAKLSDRDLDQLDSVLNLIGEGLRSFAFVESDDDRVLSDLIEVWSSMEDSREKEGKFKELSDAIKGASY